MTAEIDAFPYWSWATDSSLFWQAYDAAGYYVEIIDWTDWLDDDYAPDGGADWEYELYVVQDDLAAYEWATNDNMDDADAMYDLAAESTEDDYWYYWWVFGDVAPDQNYSLQVFGEIETPGDEDWRVFEVDDESVADYPYLQVSFWDDYCGLLDPIVTVYDETGALIGRTTVMIPARS